MRKASEYASKVKNISETLEQLVLDMTKDLRESEQKFRSIVEYAADAIITVGPDTRVTSWNQGAANIFDYREDEVIGLEIDDLIARGGAIDEAQNLSKQVLKGESIRSLEATRYSKSGHERSVLLSAAPIFNEKNEVEAVSLIYKDISELKRAHLQLVQTEKQATLGVIAGSIGHELNNLVGGLLLQARLLQRYYDNPERVKEVNELFLSSLEKVALHSKNLLSLSSPSTPSLEALDLEAVLEETTDTLILSGVLKHYRIVRDLCEERVYVQGDRHLLEQVIRNLEINSAHAMGDGGTLTLRSRLSEDKKRLIISISDTGNGIAPEIRDRIFEPFFTTKSEGQGTGLGLPIVKKIIEQHRGTLELESEVGKGTTIEIGIPTAG